MVRRRVPRRDRLGFKTTPEDLYQLYIGEAAATHTVGEPDVARILADGAIPAADWLESLGVRWSRKKAQKFFLNIEEGVRLGQVLIPALEAKAKSLGVAMRTRRPRHRCHLQDPERRHALRRESGDSRDWRIRGEPPHDREVYR